MILHGLRVFHKSVPASHSDVKLPYTRARPVGIGEVLRRTIGKSLMTVLKSDITRAAGVFRKAFASMSTAQHLLVNADNAFNCLNRAVALHNICPPHATTLTNIYRATSRLFFYWSDDTFLRRRYHSRMPPVQGDVRPECHAIDQQMPECAIH